MAFFSDKNYIGVWKEQDSTGTVIKYKCGPSLSSENTVKSSPSITSFSVYKKMPDKYLIIIENEELGYFEIHSISCSSLNYEVPLFTSYYSNFTIAANAEKTFFITSTDYSAIIIQEYIDSQLIWNDPFLISLCTPAISFKSVLLDNTLLVFWLDLDSNSMNVAKCLNSNCVQPLFFLESTNAYSYDKNDNLIILGRQTIYNSNYALSQYFFHKYNFNLESTERSFSLFLQSNTKLAGIKILDPETTLVMYVQDNYIIYQIIEGSHLRINEKYITQGQLSGEINIYTGSCREGNNLKQCNADLSYMSGNTQYVMGLNLCWEINEN
jgi:hypothetical protein